MKKKNELNMIYDKSGNRPCEWGDFALDPKRGKFLWPSPKVKPSNLKYIKKLLSFAKQPKPAVILLLILLILLLYI